MCMSINESKMSNTILYVGPAERDGKLIHVIGYQNKAKNFGNGPNAMLLPFPTEVPMTEDNVIDTSECKKILTDMESAFKIRRRSTKGLGEFYGASAAGSAVVFEHGSYSIVLAEKASQIPEALKRVPSDKRPTNLKLKFFIDISRIYPNWPIALCCFNAAVDKPEPMLWWYEPKDPTKLFAPALDCHDGNPPDLDKKVSVDHMIIAGSNKRGKEVRFSDNTSSIKDYLPKFFEGRKWEGKYPNGDFLIDVDRLDSYKLTVERITP